MTLDINVLWDRSKDLDLVENMNRNSWFIKKGIGGRIMRVDKIVYSLGIKNAGPRRRNETTELDPRLSVN